MRTIAVYEAKTKFSELLAAVEHGEQVTITRRGQPVVRMVAVAAPAELSQNQQARVSSAFGRLRELRKGVSLGMDVRAAIEEGRD